MDQYIKASSVQLIHSGDEFFRVAKEMIHSAQKVIHLQTYIFGEDQTGKEISDALIEASKRGVKVLVLVDGYGSKELSRNFITQMKNAGIQFRFFSSFFSQESISHVRRLHHKILVVDEEQMMIGGLNIGNKYRGTQTKKAWLDFAVLVKGACCSRIQQLCDMFYHKKNFNWEKKPKRMTDHGPLVRFRRNDWLRGKNEIYSSYKKAFRRSRKSVTVVGSYFLPGFFFMRYIQNAVKRGVRVRIIVGAISDIPFFHSAEKYLYDDLLRHGVEIYEWNDSVLHGKAAIVDEEWCTIGSYNLNNLSKYKTIELNVDVKDKEFARIFSKDVEALILEHCTYVTPTIHKKNLNIFARIRRTLAYYYYRFFMYLVSSRD